MCYTDAPSGHIVFADGFLAIGIGNFNELVDGVVSEVSVDAGGFEGCRNGKDIDELPYYPQK
jgi:hypothetical protein